MYLGVSPFIAYQTMSRMYEAMGNRIAAIEALEKALEVQEDISLRGRLEQLRRRVR
jgi:hypothetical protein